MPKHIRTALLASLALAATPAAADAADRYVSKSGNDASKTCGELNPCLTLKRAYEVGQSGDTIRIGPGSFDTEGYDPGDETFHLLGAGAGTLDAFDPTKQTALASGVRLTADGSSVRKLRIDGSWREGLSLGTTGGPRSFVVEDSVLIGGFWSQIPAGLSAQGVEVDLRRSVVRTAKNEQGKVTAEIGGGTLRAEDSTFVSEGGTAVNAVAGSTVSLTRAVVSGGNFGVVADNSAVVVDRSRASARTSALVVRSGNQSGSMTVSDSLVTTAADAYNGASALSLAPLGADTTSAATIRRSTLLVQATEASGAVDLNLTGAGIAALDLRGSVVHASAANVPDVSSEGSVAKVQAAASHSSFTDVSGVGGLVAGSGTNVAGDPMLDADGVPQAGSPLLDRGDAAALPAGALDLAGNPRVQDSLADGQCAPRVDIGAVEAAGVATCPAGTQEEKPVVTEQQKPVVTPKDTVKPLISAAAATRRAVRWTLSEAAGTKIKVQKRVRRNGRARWVTVRRISDTGKA